MNNEVMGGVVISPVSERPDKLLCFLPVSAICDSQGQIVTPFILFLRHSRPQTIPPHTLQNCVQTTHSSAGGAGDGTDGWTEGKRGEVAGRKNSKVKLVRGEERTRGKLVEDLSTTGSLHTGGDGLPGYSGERLQSKINPGEEEDEDEDEDGTQVWRKMRETTQPINS